ncbi:MAG: hypothetical protein JO253_04680 [Alphaproteobacteria bacterium]|nr:hypothetical protein [Alphaproteobacteria bacterium]
MATKRGISTAVKQAIAYLKKNPETEGSELARRFGINVATVYRSKWWKELKGKVAS